MQTDCATKQMASQSTSKGYLDKTRKLTAPQKSPRISKTEISEEFFFFWRFCTYESSTKLYEKIAWDQIFTTESDIILQKCVNFGRVHVFSRVIWGEKVKTPVTKGGNGFCQEHMFPQEPYKMSSIFNWERKWQMTNPEW
jgi:hypothetical protein